MLSPSLGARAAQSRRGLKAPSALWGRGYRREARGGGQGSSGTRVEPLRSESVRGTLVSLVGAEGTTGGGGEMSRNLINRNGEGDCGPRNPGAECRRHRAAA